MKTNYSIFIVLVFSTVIANAQITIGLGTGIGTYQMNQLKDINEEIANQYGVTGNLTSSFPAFPIYDIGIQLQKQHHHFGVFWSLNSTGSRVSYQDYSGKWFTEMVAVANNYGVSYGLSVMDSDLWQIIPSVKVGVINTKLQLNDFLQLEGSQPQSATFDFISKSLCIDPGISLERRLHPSVYLSCDIRYLTDWQNELTLKSNKQFYLLNNKLEPQSANWSGLRLLLTIGYKFQKNSQTNAVGATN